MVKHFYGGNGYGFTRMELEPGHGADEINRFDQLDFFCCEYSNPVLQKRQFATGVNYKPFMMQRQKVYMVYFH